MSNPHICFLLGNEVTLENLTFDLDTFNLTKKAHLRKGLNNSDLTDVGMVNFLGKLVEKSKCS